MKAIIDKSIISGKIKAPESKSQGIRLIFLSLLTKIKLYNYTPSDDIKMAINAVNSIRSKANYIYVGGSATTLRILIPIVAALKLKVTIDGDESLRKRPITSIIKALKNTKFSSTSLPLTIEGNGLSEEIEIEGWESSQYITGLIFAYHLIGGGRIKIIPPISSKSYIEMTIDLFNRFGSDVRLENNTIFVNPKPLREYEGEIPGDYALSSFYAIASVISENKIRIDGLYDPPEYFGDHEIVNILSNIGVKSYYLKHSWFVEYTGELSPLDINVNDVPDLSTSLAAISAIAKGTSKISGIERLKIKESNRIETIINSLKAFGIEAEYKDDSIIIKGSEIKKGSIICPNDHRIAMLAADLSVKEGGEIEKAECVNKSNPRFWEDLISLGGKISLK
ncbi:3-phosphoshikimate 1-carboxyvinyltransferase [Acidianus sulfidivorans JP7]|uniref:3-phosphoshikimate 1-carboxyvinyltransferase n=1 Tax=Acidianus sulfidivorans JP7 TaxID=619593 RepID=A0A2U9INQ8_9CREN|nr:3-phosphoshikimate 1-carboxyvinyltransferase [Acidianus sulfidivorans]AWR97642.1 3-phosphoshikimate 1-carboxyvinyltransferase [Acidianus sulfidivorans JP7]